MVELRTVHVPFVVIGPALAWLASFGLLAWVTWGGGPASVMPWTALTGAAAVAWTAVAGVSIMSRQAVDATVRKIVLHDQASKLTKI